MIYVAAFLLFPLVLIYTLALVMIATGLAPED